MRSRVRRGRVLSLPVSRTNPRSAERRRHQRVKVSIAGRYMLENKQEFPCRTVDASPGGLLIAGPARGAVGERVVFYFEELGRLEGMIVRHVEGGFAVALILPASKRERVADLLTWMANSDADDGVALPVLSEPPHAVHVTPRSHASRASRRTVFLWQGKPGEPCSPGSERIESARGCASSPPTRTVHLSRDSISYALNHFARTTVRNPAIVRYAISRIRIMLAKTSIQSSNIVDFPHPIGYTRSVKKAVQQAPRDPQSGPPTSGWGTPTPQAAPAGVQSGASALELTTCCRWPMLSDTTACCHIPWQEAP